jgi:hypothetical protein
MPGRSMNSRLGRSGPRIVTQILSAMISSAGRAVMMADTRSRMALLSTTLSSPRKVT